MEQPHPFALQQFRSDGQSILAEFGRESGDSHILDVATNQFVFDALIEQSLFEVLDFREDGTPWRLWLGSRNSQIVVEPPRAFGRSLVDSSSLPVSTLAAAFAANDNNVERVAQWFDIPRNAVEAALHWNASLAA